MDSFEFNKIFAAVLVAGITAMLAGFVAEHLVHPHELEKNAVEIAGMEGSAGGGQAEAMAEPVLGLIAAADVEKGKSLSKACASCHSFDKGGPVKTGPSLWGVVGRGKGSSAGFSYSAGMTAMGGNWGYAELNKFLWKPKKYISDTKMNFVGLKKPEDRAAIIAWLRTLSDSPAGLPGEGEIAAEAAELAPPPAAAEDPAAVPVEGGAAPAEGETAAPATAEPAAPPPAEPAAAPAAH
ncbi:MAG TPA: cytochrome c family protein [Rhodospirillaceae bacterium]|nr:cytochrome c family protein [Rhodospirillaceae bacterium]